MMMTATDTDFAALCAAIDAGDDDCLPILADWLEENGEFQRAAGLRIIARCYRPFNECMWVRDRTLPYRTFSPTSESIVPGAVWDRLSGWCSRDGNETCYYSSRSAAFLALADACQPRDGG